jgi:large subunit ribosomal protein L6
MSRIGKQPVPIPSGVTLDVSDREVSVKGPKGSLSGTLPVGISLEVVDGEARVTRPDDTGPNRSKHGLARALVANMVTGVTDGFVKELEIQGVGYRAEVKGKTLALTLGFSHPVELAIPEGLKVAVAENRIRIVGADRGRVGQFASNVREVRAAEPYKGKGVRYVGEQIRRKVGKAAVG